MRASVPTPAGHGPQVLVGPLACLLLATVWSTMATVAPAGAGTGGKGLGAELYATQCVSCHGVAGDGVEGRGPSLLDEGPAAVDFVLRTGRMPLAAPGEQATRGPTRYTEAEIEALVDHVGGWGAGPGIPSVDPSRGDVASGGSIFRLNCAACHVATGAGSVIGSDRRAPSLADSDPTEIGEAILVGPGAMPVFADLTPDEIEDVAVYVGALQAEGTTTARGLGGVGPVAEGLAAWLLGLLPIVALTRWIGLGRTERTGEDIGVR